MIISFKPFYAARNQILINTIVVFRISRRVLLWINTFGNEQHHTLVRSCKKNTVRINKITLLFWFVSVHPFRAPERVMVPIAVFAVSAKISVPTYNTPSLFLVLEP